MAFQKIKEKILLRKFQKELKGAPEIRNTSTKEIFNVGILTTQTYSEKNQLSEKLTSTIDTIRNVQVYSFKLYDKYDEKSYKHFTENEFDWRGEIKEPSFESFLEKPFDLLIGYFDTKHLYLEYAALKSNATFKIGFAGVNDKIFDMVISEKPTNIDRFMEVTKQYLKILNKI
ncbi:MAG: hypothetical protein HWD85_05030 [Flavobacteriaceae bacterium]|nr:hypothetical protein [Flavobacteriaceae bacterium]